MPDAPNPNNLRVLLAAAECAPLVRETAVGDVLSALAAALLDRGVDVRVLLPGYPRVREACQDAPEVARIEAVGREFGLLESKLPSGVPLYVAANAALFERGGTPFKADDGEDWTDNPVRFAALSRVAAILGTPASPLDWKPVVVHSHDWPTALASLWLADVEGPRSGSVLTVHDFTLRGTFDASEVEAIGLPALRLGPDGLDLHGRASFLKGGLLTTDMIVAPSPNYAREIQGPGLGRGLEDALQARVGAIRGVLNGIDAVRWNPMTDEHIPSHYGALTLERKLPNKRALKRRLSLGGGDDAPIFGVVGEISWRKGIDTLVGAIDAIEALGGQVVVAGDGDREVIDRLKFVAARRPDCAAVAIGDDPGLAHLAMAGCDALLVPSRVEPCGENAMLAQRYGTPPIVNMTGGLLDTVNDDTGFLMGEASVEALVDAVGRAMASWMDQKRWKRMQGLGMTRDFGWDGAARAYHGIYERVRRAVG